MPYWGQLAERVQTVWAAQAESPLLWLTLTLLVYAAATHLSARVSHPWVRPFLNPVLTSIVGIVLLLRLSGTPYETYFAGARFIHFLLGPATVALALPLYAYLAKLQEQGGPLLVALSIGSLVAILSAVGIGYTLGASQVTLLSLAPKSVTTAIAMGIAEQVGGAPSLTAVLVILTGIVGAVSAQPLLDALRIRDDAVRGFAIGLASHGIGTARAFQMSEEAGAFSGLGMGLNGILTTLLVPLLLDLLGLLP